VIFLNAGEDETRSSWLFSMVPVSHGVSNDDDSVSSSVASGMSSSGPGSEKLAESGLVIKGRGDIEVKQWDKVFGEGGALGSRGRERVSTVRSLRVVLWTGEGTVESAEPCTEAY